MAEVKMRCSKCNGHGQIIAWAETLPEGGVTVKEKQCEDDSDKVSIEKLKEENEELRQCLEAAYDERDAESARNKIDAVVINMPFGEYPYDLYECKIVSRSYSEKSITVECEDVQSKIAILVKERNEYLDKAIRFDLDQIGIENREKEAEELVELRARVVELESALKRDK